MTLLDDEALRAAFTKYRTPYADEGSQRWRERYLQTVNRIRDASQPEWLTPEFQRELWEGSGVSGIGSGSSVTLAGAYEDQDLARFLLDLRDKGLPEDALAAAVEVQRSYDEIMVAVRPRHTTRRPQARIVRLLAGLYPHHMTCLMDWRRTQQVQSLVGAAKANTDFVGQNPMIRARLREALAGEPGDDIEHAMFTWFLWENNFFKPESGAVETIGASRQSTSVPEFSLLPAASQRRSLFAVKNNVALLVSIVRECEQGISRDDLVDLIQQEAPQLSEVSANQVVNQALGGGLGLIRYADGAYTPTERGLELLNASEPGSILRAPLVGRVFGMGHLLLRLHKQGPMSRLDAARWLQSLVPTWKSTMPGSYIVGWAEVAGLAQSKKVQGRAEISLTDDGEEYALALPADFETRWRIEAEEADEGDDEGATPDVALQLSTVQGVSAQDYDVDQIVLEGCFLKPASIRAWRTIVSKLAGSAGSLS